METAVPFVQHNTTLNLMTDASDFGWSGVLLPFQVNGVWSPWERSNSINWRELKAILASVILFRKSLRGHSVRVLSDNKVALSCIYNQGSLHAPALYDLSRELLLFCQQQNISLVPVHIEGALNVLADKGSRKGPIETEWSLDPEYFNWICHFYNLCPQVDLFATRENTQLPSFVSPCPDPLAIFWDAMFLNWNTFRCIYLFPPKNFLDSVLTKLLDYQGTGILVAPYWESQSWFHHLRTRVRGGVPLPRGYFLSQSHSLGISYLREPWNLWAWLL